MMYKQKYLKYKKKYIDIKDDINRRKLARVEILSKYDKNKDKFISIDEYLSEEISKGPKASPGQINYWYQNYENIFNYFLIILNKFKELELLCIPNHVLKQGKIIIRAASAYFVNDNYIFVPNNMKNELKKCESIGTTRFIYFTFIIVQKSLEELTHANIVIIDIHKKTIERFEPYGYIPISNKIDKLFNEDVLPKLELTNYKYIPPTEISPKIGIQSKADAYYGMCVTISMMYLQLRIMNPDVPIKKVINYLLKMTKEKLTSIILKYAKYVEETLKDNTKYVNELNEQLYYVIYNLS